MRVIRARNVASALPLGVELLLSSGRREESRAGAVLVSPEPVTTVYEDPTERVLHSAVRDANPFFHLAEALWMLAGRDDAALLNCFVADFGMRFAESGGAGNSRVHGAYGRRWRGALGFDQLSAVVDKLRANHGDRQAVIQMWDARPSDRAGYANDRIEDTGSDDLRGEWRDRPCNTHAYLRVRTEPEQDSVLDLTVCCRSNDAVWGAYGANAVHFSVLQEYLSAAIGVGVGRYYQISNNFHVYESELDRLRRRASGCSLGELPARLHDQRHPALRPAPLVDDQETFLREVEFVLVGYETILSPNALISLDNGFLSRTVWPVLMSHRAWRNGREEAAQTWLESIEAEDWRVACSEWVERRAARRRRTAA